MKFGDAEILHSAHKPESINAHKAKMIRDAILPTLMSEHKRGVSESDLEPHGMLDFAVKAPPNMYVKDGYGWSHEKGGLLVSVMFYVNRKHKVFEGKYLAGHIEVRCLMEDREAYDQPDAGELLDFLITTIRDTEFSEEFLNNVGLIKLPK